jgi:hypothetical protein
MDMVKSNHTWPCRLNGIEEYSLGEEMLLYFPDFEKGFSLNSSSKAIWELCDGRHTLAEISQELGQRLGVSGNELLLNELLSDVIVTITQLRDLGVLELEEAPPTKST